MYSRLRNSAEPDVESIHGRVAVESASADREVGVGQIFYGTDYAFDWPVGVDFILNAPFLSHAEKEAILGGNLIKLLRIAA